MISSAQPVLYSLVRGSAVSIGFHLHCICTDSEHQQPLQKLSPGDWSSHLDLNLLEQLCIDWLLFTLPVSRFEAHPKTLLLVYKSPSVTVCNPSNLQ